MQVDSSLVRGATHLATRCDHCKCSSTYWRAYSPHFRARSWSRTIVRTAPASASGFSGGTAIPAFASHTRRAVSPFPEKINGLPDESMGNNFDGRAASNSGILFKEDSPHAAMETYLVNSSS